MASTGAKLRWASYSPLIRCKLPGPQLPATDCQSARELSLRAGREGCGFFVTYVHPANRAAAPQRVLHRIEAVADDALNALDAGLG